MTPDTKQLAEQIKQVQSYQGLFDDEDRTLVDADAHEAALNIIHQLIDVVRIQHKAAIFLFPHMHKLSCGKYQTEAKLNYQRLKEAIALSAPLVEDV